MLVFVANQTTRQKVRLNQNLKTVANAQNWQTTLSSLHDLSNNRSLRSNRTTTQIVAIAKTARQNYSINFVQVRVSVPQRNSFSTRQTHGTGRIADTLAAADPRVHVLHRQTKDGLGHAYRAGLRRALDLGVTFLDLADLDVAGRDVADVKICVAACSTIAEEMRLDSASPSMNSMTM